MAYGIVNVYGSGVETHNKNENAHPDIRQAIDELRTAIISGEVASALLTSDGEPIATSGNVEIDAYRIFL